MTLSDQACFLYVRWIIHRDYVEHKFNSSNCLAHLED